MPAESRLADRLIAALAVGAALAQVAEQWALGFPDGYISELERIMRVPHLLLVGMVVVFAVVLARGAGRWRWPIVAVLVALCLFDHFGLRWLGLALGLDDGRGG